MDVKNFPRFVYLILRSCDWARGVSKDRSGGSGFRRFVKGVRRGSRTYLSGKSFMVSS